MTEKKEKAFTLKKWDRVLIHWRMIVGLDVNSLFNKFSHYYHSESYQVELWSLFKLRTCQKSCGPYILKLRTC